MAEQKIRGAVYSRHRGEETLRELTLHDNKVEVVEILSGLN